MSRVKSEPCDGVEQDLHEGVKAEAVLTVYMHAEVVKPEIKDGVTMKAANTMNL